MSRFTERHFTLRYRTILVQSRPSTETGITEMAASSKSGDLQSRVEELRSKIKNYKPGSLTSTYKGDNFISPQKIRIGVYGVQDAGKSAFINTAFFAQRGTWEEVATEGDQYHHGGETVGRRDINFANHVLLVDNRGMRDFSVFNIYNVMKQIRGKSGGPPIDCPIFVYKYCYELGTDNCREFLGKFVTEVKDLYGTYPIVIITSVDRIRNPDEVKASFIRYGANRYNIYFMENYTTNIHDADAHKDVKVLNIIWECIKRADDNIVHRHVHRNERSIFSGICAVA